jgi:hypothetical protein
MMPIKRIRAILAPSSKERSDGTLAGHESAPELDVEQVPLRISPKAKDEDPGDFI